MSNFPDLYQNIQFTDSKTAVIVLPEIFGVTVAIKEITDRFASQFQALSFALDTFYPILKESKTFDYTTQGGDGFAVAQQITPEIFLAQLDNAIIYIKATFPQVEEIVVCGFCFGGKLAYLAGINKAVEKIISFYGSLSLSPMGTQKSPIDLLAEARRSDTSLSILGFYGMQDAFIPQEDREERVKIFLQANINYKSYEYDANHAFFNHHREKTYNQSASDAAWSKIKDFLS